MTKREAKKQACAAAWRQMQALLASDYLFDWEDRPEDMQKVHDAIAELRDELFRRAGERAVSGTT